MLSDLNQQINDVRINELKWGASGIVYSLPHFQLDNIYPVFEKYFNLEAKKVMMTKADGFVHSYYDDDVSTKNLVKLFSLFGLKSAEKLYKNGMIRFVRTATVSVFAIRCYRYELVKAVERMIACINHLADKGFLLASMIELGVIKFESVPLKPDEVAVLSYIVLTASGKEYVQANLPKLLAVEGTMPARLEEW